MSVAAPELLPPLAFASRGDHFSRFLAFCSDHDVDTSALAVYRKSDQDFGIKVTRSLMEDEIVMRIPRRLVLSTEERATGDTAFHEFVTRDPLLKEMPHLMLVMTLIREFCSSNSFWKPYIDILPTSYETPLYLDFDALLLLKPSQAFEEAGKLWRNISRQYAYFWTQMQTPSSAASRLLFKDRFSFELYR